MADFPQPSTPFGTLGNLSDSDSHDIEAGIPAIELSSRNGAPGSPVSDHFENDRIPPEPRSSNPLICLKQSIGDVILSSKLNILLLFIPVCFGCVMAKAADGALFVTSLLALVPLAAMLGDLTETVAAHTNETLGGLLNATFGNITEIIVSIIALQKGQVWLVQKSLLGSMLSNLLLVLGTSFVVGGIKHDVQKFSAIVSTTANALLFLSVLSILLPSTLALAKVCLHADSDLSYSKFISILLVIAYFVYLYFTLISHRRLFEEEDADDDESSMGLCESTVWLGIVAIAIGLLSDVLVDSIRGASKDLGMSQIFIGVVLVPIVGNAAEHAAAVTVAYRNRMNLSLGIAIGSGIQIGIFVLPLMVLIAWMMGKKMLLFFEVYEVVCIFLTIVCVGAVIQDGKSNYMSGMILMMAYILMSFGFFWHTDAYINMPEPMQCAPS